MVLPTNTASLVNELRSTLAQINMQIEAAKSDFEEAKARGVYLPDVTIYRIKTSDGRPVLAPMLLAKAECLNAIATLQGSPAARR